MQLQNEIEKYLDNAEGMYLQLEGDEIWLMIQFDDSKAVQFKSEEDYQKLVEFFKDDNITLIIKEKLSEDGQESFYRSSFVSKNTADGVNLNSVLWGEDTLQEFIEKVKQDSNIVIKLVILDKTKKKFIEHPATKKHGPLVIEDYTFEEMTKGEEDNAAESTDSGEISN